MNRSHAGSKSGLSRSAKALVIGLGLLALAASTGCDYGLSSLFMPEYSSQYSYWPGYSLYDPTDTIQGAINYRQSVMDWSNNAWDEYIRQ